MFEQLSLEGMKEFHLASVAVREGRCSPVAFKVGYENYNSQLDAIAELTYNQCYCYFNWTGAVRVPATLQYANKLSKQYSDIGDELVTGQKNSDLKNKAFFL
jgi:aubergine-like protein